MSIGKLHKLIPASLYNLPIAIPISLCYNINVPREIKRSQRTNKKNSKKFEKSLDKPHTLWYNKDKEKGSDLPQRKDLIL